MQEEIQKFAAQSQKQIEAKTNKLMTPICQKVEKALTAVAQNKDTLIFLIVSYYYIVMVELTLPLLLKQQYWHLA